MAEAVVYSSTTQFVMLFYNQVYERQEGVLFSTQTFFGRIDQATGAALAGWALSLIAFPKAAVPGHVAPGYFTGWLWRSSCRLFLG